MLLRCFLLRDQEFGFESLKVSEYCGLKFFDF